MVMLPMRAVTAMARWWGIDYWRVKNLRLDIYAWPTAAAVYWLCAPWSLLLLMLQFLLHHHATGELQKVLAILRFFFLPLVWDSLLYNHERPERQAGMCRAEGHAALPLLCLVEWRRNKFSNQAISRWMVRKWSGGAPINSSSIEVWRSIWLPQDRPGTVSHTHKKERWS